MSSRALNVPKFPRIARKSMAESIFPHLKLKERGISFASPSPISEREVKMGKWTETGSASPRTSEKTATPRATEPPSPETTPAKITKEDISPDKCYDFSSALLLLKDGQRISRVAWQTPDTFLSVPLYQGEKEVPAPNIWGDHNITSAINNGGTLIVSKYVSLHTSDKKVIMGWTPTSEDLFASDYYAPDLLP